MEHLHAWVINMGFATHLVAVSKRVQTESIQEGVCPDKIKIIHNGTYIAEPPDYDKAAYRRELGISPDSFFVLSVGRLTDQKAHTYLVQAAPVVLARFPEVVFAIAGDGPLYDTLAAEIKSLRLEEKFILLGTRQDLSFLLTAADIFALPSRWEGLPVALLEAMSLGLPAVAAAVEGVEEVIEHGENGLLIPLEDANALSQALCSLLEDPDRRQRIAAAGKAHVREVYSLEEMCLRYRQLLDPGFR
jgi:glycosyltransferase involved in cell wall biosynthesis